MLRLLVRDIFIYQKRNFIVLPLLSIYMLFIMVYSANSYSGIGAAAMVISTFAAIMIAQTAFAYDEAYKANKFMRALPASTYKIVTSRYLSAFCSAGMGILCVYVFSFLLNALSGSIDGINPVKVDFSPSVLLSCAGVVLPVCSISIPALYKFGYIKAKYPLMLATIVLIAGVPALLETNIISNVMSFLEGNAIILALLAAALLFASIWLSARILSNQEQ